MPCPEGRRCERLSSDGCFHKCERERAAQTASVLVIFLVAAMKYLAFQPAEERKTCSGSQFGAIHSILAGGKREGSCRGLQLWWWWGLAGVWVDQEAKRGLEQSPGWDRNCSALPLGTTSSCTDPLKAPQRPQTVPLAGDQMYKHVSLGRTFHTQTLKSHSLCPR